MNIKITLFVFLSIFSFSASANYSDSPELPNKPGANLVKPLIDVVNSKDERTITQFIKKNFDEEFLNRFPMDAHVSYLLGAIVNKGDISYHSVRSYDNPPADNEIVAILRDNRTENWRAIVLMINNDNGKIESVEFSPARPPSNLPKEGAISLDKAVNVLNDYVNRMAEKDVFSGTVLLAKGEKVLFSSAKGLSSKRFDVANNINTRFNLGSMNKMFTSVAIMRLVQDGKLKLTDRLSQFADESWLPISISEKIEIRHLLTHSSGLGNYFNQVYFDSSKNKFRKLDDYKPLLDGHNLSFEPGTSNGYSNAGMLMLGVVIEKVSGKDYFSFIKETIYKPAGMTRSDSYEMDQPVKNLAIGYEPARNETGWTNNIYTHVLKGGPAGGGFSTVKDLHKFALALTQFKLLDKKHTEMLYSAKPELHSPFYGFGFGVRPLDNDTVVGHSGGFPGISANMDIYLKQGYVAIVLSNYGSGASPVEAKMRNLLNRVK